jgi:hypothetical protein
MGQPPPLERRDGRAAGVPARRRGSHAHRSLGDRAGRLPAHHQIAVKGREVAAGAEAIMRFITAIALLAGTAGAQGANH